MPLCLACLALAAAPSRLAAQDNKGFTTEGATDAGIATSTPYDKFIAIDMLVAAAGAEKTTFWATYLNHMQATIDPDKFSDKAVSLPVLLGFRICDGVMAIKARNAEKLNGCASDIEKLARKMNVPDDRMTRARNVRIHANRGEWARVYLELGYLQQDINRVFAEFGDKDSKKIVMAAGWLQGARYTSTIISEHYTEETSGLLREPRLAEALAKQLKSIEAGKLSSPLITALVAALGDLGALINVPMNGSIAKDKVVKISSTASDAVRACVAAAK